MKKTKKQSLIGEIEEMTSDHMGPAYGWHLEMELLDEMTTKQLVLVLKLMKFSIRSVEVPSF